MAIASVALSQQPPQPQPASPSQQPYRRRRPRRTYGVRRRRRRHGAARFKQEELEQIVAPIALYPDSLLSQILMASTYPVEVVQAERWAKENKAFKGDALAKAPGGADLGSERQVAGQLPRSADDDEREARLDRQARRRVHRAQKEVMDTSSSCAARRRLQGNLKQRAAEVMVEAVAGDARPRRAPTTQVITIESTSPQVVYVPTYNPTVVYGGWPYPSYPPYSYYPPGYVAGQRRSSVRRGRGGRRGVGLRVGRCNWGHGGDVDVDIDQNVNINSNIDREKYKAERDARQTDRQGNRTERQAKSRRQPRRGELVPA